MNNTLVDYGHPLTQFKIIGFSGKLGSGKTTFCNYLRGLVLHNHEKRSFAENLRKCLSIICNIPLEETRSLDDKERYFPELDLTFGQLLQKFGTDTGRATHPDLWTWSLFQQFDVSSSLWIIDDVRCPNEAKDIKKRGGLIIRLEGDPGKVRDKTSRDLNHYTETALDDYDKFDIILNTDEHFGKWDLMLEKVTQAVTVSRLTPFLLDHQMTSLIVFIDGVNDELRMMINMMLHHKDEIQDHQKTKQAYIDILVSRAERIMKLKAKRKRTDPMDDIQDANQCYHSVENIDTTFKEMIENKLLIVYNK